MLTATSHRPRLDLHDRRTRLPPTERRTASKPAAVAPAASDAPAASEAPARQPTAASQMESRQMMRQQEAMLRSHLLADRSADRTPKAEASTLANEVYQDEGDTNCLDSAVTTLEKLQEAGEDISQYSVVLMKNTEDPTEPGHAGLLAPDGTFYDQAGGHDYEAFKAEHPELEVLTNKDGELPRGDEVLDAMKLPPGAERDAALEAAGLSEIANEEVAFPPLIILGGIALAGIILAGCSDPGSAPSGGSAPSAGGALPMDVASIQARTIQGLQNGTSDDAFRQQIANDFKGLGMNDSQRVMNEVRSQGLMNEFLDATLRDPTGAAVDPTLRANIEKMMNTGRLDFMAETLASAGIGAFSPAAGDTIPNGEPNPHFDGTDLWMNMDVIGADPSRQLTHEMFHAYSDAHGRTGGSSLDEGFGTALIDYAFTNSNYDIAERVYGTANWKRDHPTSPTPGFPLGSAAGLDAEAREVMAAIASRDSSGLAWSDDAQLLSDYQTYFEPLDRFTDGDADGNADWEQPGGTYDQALQQMLKARAGGP